MDEHLPLGSPDAATLAGLLEKERARTAAVEQEVRRLQAGLMRQNELIIHLQRRDATRQEELDGLRQVTAALTEQNALLRTRIAELEAANARLRGTPPGRPPTSAPASRPAAAPREKRQRRRRAGDQNHGRQKAARPNRWESHAVEACPQCGEHLAGGWIVRRVQVIDLPAPAPLEITEHRIIRRQCPRCGRRVLPPPVGSTHGRIGRSCFGPRLTAGVATMATVERLPGRVIQERLQREYGLTISHGGIIQLLQRTAAAGTATYAALQAAARASPVVHADETGWRENGQQTTIWIVCTPALIAVSHGRRTNAAIDGILGADYQGTIVADCYAAYDHFPGRKQRCWAHLVRDLQALLYEHVDHPETVAWTEGIFAVYQQARDAQRTAPTGWTSQAMRVREVRARQCEALIRLLCPAQPDRTLPYATLALRLRKYLAELFTFVRDPAVPATNNDAERGLRPLVIARKVSGGTRSAVGSTTRMVLYSLAATARRQGQDPSTLFQSLLLMPDGMPAPLTLSHTS